MLIRHDLKLVFLHVPKCAGKQLRALFVDTAPPGSLLELWNYGYSPILHRYVDLAHLPLRDLKTYPEYAYLDHYRVIACIRNPYARLPSAVNEYYRQRSREDESLANQNRLTPEMKEHYYSQIPSRHAQTDPRFIHSLPIHHFTHLGENPKVDFLLRCESLKTDFLNLAEQLGWPQLMHEQATANLVDRQEAPQTCDLSDRELALANRLYGVDINTFGYPLLASPGDSEPEPSRDQASIDCLHQAPAVSWHWGPTAANSFARTLKPQRR